MRATLYIVALVLVILWVYGYYVYDAGVGIHLLLIFAIISFELKVLSSKKPVK